MRLLTALLGFAVIGSALSDAVCPVQRRFLATAERGDSPVFVRSGEEVELVCRPSDDAGCRWVSGKNRKVLSDDCSLIASGNGVFKCVQGGKTIGSVQLKASSADQVYPYIDYPHHDRYSGFMVSAEQERMRIGHMCSDSGKFIERSLICDGTRHCSNGEDEEGCGLPCGAPSAGDGTALAESTLQLYPHGASVSYSCPPGLGFRNTLGRYRRTCREGLWSGAPPACHPNLAFGRPSAITGRPVLGLGPELAVDGQVNTWTMMTPGAGAQSLNVTLSANVSTDVDVVLVRTLSPRYEVAVLSEGSRVTCECDKNVTKDPELAGMAKCTCPVIPDAAEGASGPLTVEISSTYAALMSLSIAEVAAFEAPQQVADECALLDQPAHGRFETESSGGVRLFCEAGYRASCADVLSCSTAAGAVCRPVRCPPPPTLPLAVIVSSNGTGWSAVTEYRCAAGYQLYPPEQRTSSVCRDGLWSLSHLACLPESDMRVVALRLGQQHAQSVAELREELDTLLSGQLLLLRQLERTQHRLRRVEQTLNIEWTESSEGEETEQVEGEEEEEEEREEEESEVM